VRLPIHPDVDSLNVAAAAAVTFAVVDRGAARARLQP
jgi:tRNA G18 (ribose-2'-O)-methylase SpoU